MAEELSAFKVKEWDGKSPLPGPWIVTFKIDGVRAIWLPEEKRWVSRAGKPLYNLPDYGELHTMATQFEVYLGSLKDTVRAVRTQKLKEDTPRVYPTDLYELWPFVSPRLHRGGVVPAEDTLDATDAGCLLAGALRLGYEGIVLRRPGDNPTEFVKIKPKQTRDLVVTGAVEGTGKHAGRLGYLTTSLGRVGTGFSDEEREAMWARRHADLIGTTIEVEAMQLTPAGKMRHARFIRERFDKDAAFTNTEE